MPENSLTITIVIPAYNEARHIGACLDSIAAQTVKPDEVIVVDNNSTDGTAEIARDYPFVTLLRESKQGLIPARNKGFNAARGDILGRINADSVLAADWVARVTAQFAFSNKLGGLTGPAFTHIGPFISGESTLDSIAYLKQSEAYFRVHLVWGANMAIRTTAWREIKSETCTEDSLVHEDQDLSLLLAGYGWQTNFDKNVTINTDGGDHYFMWPKFKEYMLRRWQTKARHEAMGTLDKPGARKLSVWYCLSVWAVRSIPFPGVFGSASFVYWHSLQLLKSLKYHARRLPEFKSKIIS